ncbi:hypothetical protein SKAU_G00216180 [Synaphobranchus kaupii]|uniref:Secreted protein n=1 Tax=Synaphobranchus kaupii TaxID=118154 RepID=A0A9Q1FAG2_SYNKA|nr:hypothetical protein SKAU_G00216180 [Synaphobranchus kaupii]
MMPGECRGIISLCLPSLGVLLLLDEAEMSEEGEMSHPSPCSCWPPLACPAPPAVRKSLRCRVSQISVAMVR